MDLPLPNMFYGDPPQEQENHPAVDDNWADAFDEQHNLRPQEAYERALQEQREAEDIAIRQKEEAIIDYVRLLVDDAQPWEVSNAWSKVAQRSTEPSQAYFLRIFAAFYRFRIVRLRRLPLTRVEEIYYQTAKYVYNELKLDNLPADSAILKSDEAQALIEELHKEQKRVWSQVPHGRRIRGI